jgi:hypothetical protein
LPVGQDDVAAPLLEVQGGADADHARAQYENIGPAFCHPALRKLNVTGLLRLLTSTPVMPARSAPTARFIGKSRLRGG